MKPFSRHPAFATVSLLSACGGGAIYPTDEHAGTAALMAQVNAPQPDCAADGCNTPRIVDRLAEQFRASAAPPAAAEPSAVALSAPADPAGADSQDRAVPAAPAPQAQ